jgi:hypothetical protein
MAKQVAKKAIAPERRTSGAIKTAIRTTLARSAGVKAGALLASSFSSASESESDPITDILLARQVTD